MPVGVVILLQVVRKIHGGDDGMKDPREVTERKCLGRVFQASWEAWARPCCGKVV